MTIPACREMLVQQGDLGASTACPGRADCRSSDAEQSDLAACAGAASGSESAPFTSDDEARADLEEVLVRRGDVGAGAARAPFHPWPALQDSVMSARDAEEMRVHIAQAA